MGNTNNGNKPKRKRRATIGITKNINQHTVDKENKGKLPNNVRISVDDSRQQFGPPKKKIIPGINIMSPVPNYPNYESKQDTNDIKNFHKITISTHHSANQHKIVSQTPQKFIRKTPNTFLSPTNSLRRNSGTLGQNTFSPSQYKSRQSVSTASPSKYVPTQSPIASPNKSQTKKKEIIIASRFKLIKKLGKGSFGIAYKSLDLQTNAIIAIKLERKREDRAVETNTREINILERLHHCSRVPKLLWHGTYKQYRVMAMELQGLNLSDLYAICDMKFSLKTAIYIIIECIHCMQDIHSKGIVHRDIKPQNFIISRDRHSNKIYVIDFGLSSWFVNSVNEHIEYNDECSPVGTARYASLNNHRGIHQTRRDDLESIGFMIIYFLTSELPWQGQRHVGRVKKWKKIEQKKASVSNHALTQGLPMEFCYYLDAVRKLKYSEQPDYSRLIKVFKKLYVKQGYYAQDMDRLHKTDPNSEIVCDYDPDYNFSVADIIIPDWR